MWWDTYPINFIFAEYNRAPCIGCTFPGRFLVRANQRLDNGRRRSINGVGFDLPIGVPVSDLWRRKPSVKSQNRELLLIGINASIHSTPLSKDPAQVIKLLRQMGH
jgi:hypothetical protein